MIILILLAYALLAVADPLRLYKNGPRKDFYACSAFYLCGLVLAIALEAKVPVPSPALPIKQAVKFIMGT